MGDMIRSGWSDGSVPWTALYKAAMVVCLLVAAAFAALVLIDLLLPNTHYLDPLFDALGG